jgi:hypothetical protein
MKRLAKVPAERDMEAELTERLGCEKHGQAAKASAKRPNGKAAKELRTDHSQMEISAPRDRAGGLRAAYRSQTPGETKFPQSFGIWRQNPVDVRLGVERPADTGPPQRYLAVEFRRN